MEQRFKNLLDDLNLHGAESWEKLYVQYGQQEMRDLLRSTHVPTLEGPMGLATALGHRGRTSFGSDGSYIVKPNSAASQILLRGVRWELENRRWSFTEYYDDRKTILKMVRERETLFVYAQWHDPAPQTVRNYLAEKAIRFHTRARFLLAVRDVRPYEALIEEYSFLHLVKLEVVLPPSSVKNPRTVA